MCKSVKGAAYFGSSIHVVAAFVFLLWFLFDTVITEVHIDLWRCRQSVEDTPRKHNDLVHYLNLPFKFLYYACLCVTGIYIFRGVERNAPRIIKFALLVFVIVQIIGFALFITISFNYWDDSDVQINNKLPTPSRLLDPNNPPQHPDHDQVYDIVGSYDESSGEQDYSINIEVFSHSPNTSPPARLHPHLHPPEIHHSQDIGLGQKPIFLPELDNYHKNEDVSKNLESGPENLVLASEPTEMTPISDFDHGFATPQNSSMSSPDVEVVRILQKDGREFLTFPSVPQSMVLDPGVVSTLEKTGESLVEEEVTAVLESPLDVDNSATTTPMPIEKREPEKPEVKVQPEVKVPLKKLSHNQLVTLVFQVFLVGFNALFSFIYVAVLIVHLTTL